MRERARVCVCVSVQSATKTMTWAYSAYFATIWSSAVLAIPAAIALGAWVIIIITQSADDDDADTRALLWWQIPTLVVLLLWTTLLRLHGPRVLLRAGAWPAICTSDLKPSGNDVDQLVADLRNDGRVLNAVGSGWGYFLYRRGPPSPRLFLHRFTGLIKEEKGEGYQLWAGGTTIATVARALLESNPPRVFPSHPTMDYISLGSWMACANHGNGGDSNEGSSALFKFARVYDMKTRELLTVKDYIQLRRLFDLEPRGKSCVILAVAINLNATVSNVDLQKSGILIKTPQDASEWLRVGAVLRVLFLGRARQQAIGLRWDYYTGKEEDVTHRDPHFGSRFCQFLQVDVCSVIGGRNEPMENFNGVTTRYHANRWMPTVYPVQTLAVVLTGHINFEVIFTLPGRTLSGETLFELLEKLYAMHARIGGRSEVRYGELLPTTPIFLDMSLRHSFNQVFDILNSQPFYVGKVALHIGKHQVPTNPCDKVKVHEIYFGAGV